MKTDLKKAIVNFILDNEKEFQLRITSLEKFRPYIYDGEGEYLIDGEEVLDFIMSFIKLHETS